MLVLLFRDNLSNNVTVFKYSYTLPKVSMACCLQSRSVLCFSLDVKTMFHENHSAITGSQLIMDSECHFRLGHPNDFTQSFFSGLTDSVIECTSLNV